MIEQMREEFEDWFDARTNNNGGVAYYVEISGKYCFEDIQLLWEAWEASRRILLSELNGRKDEKEV